MKKKLRQRNLMSDPTLKGCLRVAELNSDPPGSLEPSTDS